jgi:hypothetical protein
MSTDERPMESDKLASLEAAYAHENVVSDTFRALESGAVRDLTAVLVRLGDRIAASCTANAEETRLLNRVCHVLSKPLRTSDMHLFADGGGVAAASSLLAVHARLPFATTAAVAGTVQRVFEHGSKPWFDARHIAKPDELHGLVRAALDVTSSSPFFRTEDSLARTIVALVVNVARDRPQACEDEWDVYAVALVGVLKRAVADPGRWFERVREVCSVMQRACTLGGASVVSPLLAAGAVEILWGCTCSDSNSADDAAGVLNSFVQAVGLKPMYARLAACGASTHVLKTPYIKKEVHAFHQTLLEFASKVHTEQVQQLEQQCKQLQDRDVACAQKVDDLADKLEQQARMLEDQAATLSKQAALLAEAEERAKCAEDRANRAESAVAAFRRGCADLAAHMAYSP